MFKLLLFAFFVLVVAIQSIGGTGVMIVLGIMAIVGMLASESSDRSRDEKSKQEAEQIAKLISDHRKELIRKHSQMVITGDYGVVDDSQWQKEKERFIDLIVLPKFPNLNRGMVLKAIELGINQGHYSYEATVQEVTKSSLNPIEYEVFCANEFRMAGWKATTTKATGDQGADVIAEKNGIKLVAQCKKYSKPVGNRAVQEAFSAKQFYGAELSAVITNASFTRAAREAGNRLGVLLLHHSDIRGEMKGNRGIDDGCSRDLGARRIPKRFR